MLSLANNVQEANGTYNSRKKNLKNNNNNRNNNSQNVKYYDGTTKNLAPLTVQFVKKAMHDFTLLAKFLRDLRDMSVDDDNKLSEDKNAKIDDDKNKTGRDQRNKLRV